MKRVYPRHIINIDKKLFKMAFKMIVKNQAVCGENIRKFEEKFADYIGVKYAIGVVSARKGLYLVLKNLNFSQDDEIIMPSYIMRFER